MTWSQMIVVTWIQFVLAAALLQQAARFALGRLTQPVDRIRLIQFSLGAVMALPLLMTLAPWPAWRLGLVAQSDEGRAATPPTAIPSSSVAVATRSATPSTSIEQDRFPLDASSDPVVSLRGGSEVGSASMTVSQNHAAIAPASPAGLNAWNVAAILIAAAHFLVFGYSIMEWAVGLLWLRRLCRGATPSTATVDAAWDLVTHGRGRRVRLLISTSLDAPLMFGWIRPVVVVPRELAKTGGTALHCCLAHEWSHVERADAFWWRCTGFCQLLLWIQPAYWALRKELRLCQDILADDRSTHAGLDAVEYSALLLGLAKSRMTVPVAGALTLLGQPSQLTKRIQMLLLRSLSLRVQCTWRFTFAMATAVVLCTLLIGSVRLETARADVVAKDLSKGSAKEASAQSQAASDNAATAQQTIETAAQSSASPQAGKDGASKAVTSPSGPMKYTCRVVDKETGKGIPGLTVVVRWSELPMDESPIRVIQERTLTTSENGEYVLEVPDDRVADQHLHFDLRFKHEAYANYSYNQTLKDIRNQEQRGERPGWESISMTSGIPVTGAIVSPEGRPLPGVVVRGASRLSRGDATSDGDGKFRLSLPKDEDAALWVFPTDYGIVEKFLAKQRGELGAIRLSPGVRVSGRVLAIDGKPVPGVPVNIQFAGTPSISSLFAGSDIRRATISDVDGRFAFDPLPAGDYQIAPEQYRRDPLEKTVFLASHAVSGVFLSQNVTLKEGSNLAPLKFQSLPFVKLQVQVVDSSGRSVNGDGFRLHDGDHLFVHGGVDSEHWSTGARPDPNGNFDIKIPHGLQDPYIQIMGTSKTNVALGIRRGRGQPLMHMPGIFPVHKGQANDDIGGIEIVSYQPARLVVSAVDEAQQSINGFRVGAVYPESVRPYGLFGDPPSNVRFRLEPDGRYHSVALQPQEGVVLTVAAAGYESATQKINVVEGITAELVVMLKKSAEKPPAPAKEDKK